MEIGKEIKIHFMPMCIQIVKFVIHGHHLGYNKQVEYHHYKQMLIICNKNLKA